MNVQRLGFLFDDRIHVETASIIGSLGSRLGPRASLAQVAMALAQLSAEQQLGDAEPGSTQPQSEGSRTLQAFLQVMDYLPVGVCVVDGNFQVRIFNRMACVLLDFPDSLFSSGLPLFRELLYFNAQRGEYGPGDPQALAEKIMDKARKMEPHHFERKRPDGRVLDIRGEPLPGGGFVTIWTDVTERAAAQEKLALRNRELEAAQQQLVQSEKLASIGQLAAGVAHEINNPIGYVHSNIGTLQTYIAELMQLLDAYEALPENPNVQALRQKIDVAYLREDIPSLIRESQEGITRVKKIVQDLKDFSRVDSSQEWQSADLHHGIDSTLNIVSNEIKYKADVVKQYGQLPPVECLPSQLSQVFMNLLVNAAHAMGAQRGCITIRTGTQDDEVWLEFEDNGSGISPELQTKIFDPFFTTKPVGKGTGLGLSLSYGIVQKHHGRITVRSEVGKGTVFRIVLPVAQALDTLSKETPHV
ncbi:PAS-domain containing protein [Simplicispira lacusdiani]|uniref:PAS-domain containing protein n=1 Tax=Simplicispira lacusdiani TaxID=2213010 RepID=UPI001E586CC6|nr:PAS-domain containing protein [Simplicispira lacusdiani]